MDMTIEQLRAVARGTATLTEDTHEIVLTEQFLKDLFLNEAYQGREHVRPIADAMKKIERRILRDPWVDICRTPEGKALDAAICKVFGFKSAHVYWPRSLTALDEDGPMTIPAARVLSKSNEHLRYGSFKNGFYDSKHNMIVYIQMANALVTRAHCTADEMTAILIHEIGHNFDFSPYTVEGFWVDAIVDIVSCLEKLDPLGAAFSGLDTASTVLDKDGTLRRIEMEIHNIKDTIGRMVPPIGVVLGGVGAAKTAWHKLIQYILVPGGLFTSMPMRFLFMPFNYTVNLFMRKGEMYADSMCAIYGYGPEQATALDKLTSAMSTFNTDLGVFAILDNYMLVFQEFYALTSGEHGSNQQRALRMMDSLKRELKDPNIDPATRKACMAELERLETTYKKVILMPDGLRYKLTQVVRTVVDAWYRNYSPDLMKVLGPEYTYAK